MPITITTNTATTDTSKSIQTVILHTERVRQIGMSMIEFKRKAVAVLK